MQIPRPAQLLFLLLIIASVSLLLFIDGTPAQESPTGPPVRAATAKKPPPDEAPVALFRPTGPDPASQPTARLVTAIKQARADFRQRLQELTVSYNANRDLEHRRAIQNEIGDLKLGLETEIMNIQLHHARDLGLDEAADEIAANLALLADQGEGEPTPSEETGEGGGDHED